MLVLESTLDDVVSGQVSGMERLALKGFWVRAPGVIHKHIP
jgi:hypothetical protein